MNYTLPAIIKKKITFRRLSSKNVIEYKVYGTFKDSNYSSGLRTELLDTIKNPYYPNPVLTEIELEYNDNATWRLPDDAFLDRDHQFRIFMKKTYESDYMVLPSIAFSYNRLNKLITLDVAMKDYDVGDKIKLEYYKDVIVKEYAVVDDCTINITPVFKDDYNYGTHNIIM